MKPSEIERQYSPGQCIVEPGSRGWEAYVIRSGEVRVEGKPGGEPELLGPGELIGAAAAIRGQPYGYRAVAQSEVTALALDVPLLNRLCLESAEFAMRLILHLAGGVAEAVSPGPAEAPAAPPSSAAGLRRLAEVILERSEEGEGPVSVDGDLRDLADHSGLSLLETYQQLQGLLEERVLRLADDQLALMDPARLRSLRRNLPA
jgi:CRP-like cAMP-binding protein